jgi:virginiamycin B lyase
LGAISKFSAALVVCSTVAFGWPQLLVIDYVSPQLFQVQEIAPGPDGALWFAQFNAIGRVTTAGVFTYYSLPASGATPTGIVAGPDGALWFIESTANNIGRITTSGTISEYPIPTANSGPRFITSGPDGALWFTENAGNQIGRITTSGVITELSVPTASAGVLGIAPGPDGALWFTESTGNKIGRVTTSGVFTEYVIPTAASGPRSIVAGSDGALWFTEVIANNIGRITTTGSFSEYLVPSLPSTSSSPYDITAGPDGALWFTELLFTAVGRISTTGVVSSYPGGAGLYAIGIATGPDNDIWITKQSGSRIAKGQILPVVGPSIYPDPAPGGDVGLSYHFGVRAADGASPYSNWSVNSGSLPPGLALDAATGVISGTPTAVTTQPYGPSFGVTVQDSDGNTSLEQYFSITITPALQITGPTSLPDGIVGVAYPPVSGNVFFSSTGGSMQHPLWSASGLPNGLILDPSGNLDGTPGAGTQGNYNPTFTATDTVGGTASVTLPVTVTISEPALLQITTSLAPLNINGFYNQILTASGGYPPYFWSLTAGSLPPGISLQSNYNLYGIATASGTYNFTLQVKDYANFTTTQSYTLTVGKASGPASCTYTLGSGGQVFPSAGGSGSITVNSDVGCLWTVSGVPAWVTIVGASSGTGNGSVNYVVSPNNGSSDLNATLTMAGLFFNIQEQGLSVLNLIGSMPHLAAEENWTTAFTLVNKGAASAIARLSFLRRSSRHACAATHVSSAASCFESAAGGLPR